DDTFTSMGTWEAYKQEIIAFQMVLPFAVRRLAHHRSRNLNCTNCSSGGYEFTPRVSADWDGTKVAWASNMGYGGSVPAEYADIYVIDTGSTTSRCDLNGDASINVTDLQIDVNAILTGNTSSTYDINKDGLVNVLDAQVLIN